MSDIHKTLLIPDELSGKRLDGAVASLLPEYSRSRIKQWIDNGDLTVNGKRCKPKDKVLANDKIQLDTTLVDETKATPQNIKLNIVYEDNDLLIINKATGMVVHPGAGVHEGTLLNALLYHCPTLSEVPRAGIVHRLDKDTTGLLVIAKNIIAHTRLVRQLQKRAISREYEAVVNGVFTGGGTIDAPIGRDPHHRTRMAVVESGRTAVTHFRVIERFQAHTLIHVQLETGRTHQIRVHMAHIKHPIVGDPTYGKSAYTAKGVSEDYRRTIHTMQRQALHACKLTLAHPVTKETLIFEAKLPDDFQTLVKNLEKYSIRDDNK